MQGFPPCRHLTHEPPQIFGDVCGLEVGCDFPQTSLQAEAAETQTVHCLQNAASPPNKHQADKLTADLVRILVYDKA